MKKVFTGLEVLGNSDEYRKPLEGRRLGLVANQASLDSHLQSAKRIITRLFPGQLKALFGPQHGYHGEDQDNMVETDHSYEDELNLPVYSLYSKKREPLPEMLDMIDILIIDLQDIGTRVYTFASTMLNCLKAASRSGKKVLILDRPNPLGGMIMEGNLLQPEFYSFVGPYRLPMRHGLTMAEMAQIFNEQFKIGADLEIVPMTGWNRQMLWSDTGLKWLMPSPNMPLPETAQVYPGQIIWEGTNISEGRGTCRPFEIFGAPFLNVREIKRQLNSYPIEGCYFQEISFRPTFHKWEGESCNGIMIHILDPHSYRPFLTTIYLLKTILSLHRDQFQWKQPPYEYEYERMPIDLILGDSSLRKEIEEGREVLLLKERWDEELREFFEWRKAYLIYPELPDLFNNY